MCNPASIEAALNSILHEVQMVEYISISALQWTLDKAETESDVKKMAWFYCIRRSLLDIKDLMWLQRHVTQPLLGPL